SSDVDLTEAIRFRLRERRRLRPRARGLAAAAVLLVAASASVVWNGPRRHALVPGQGSIALKTARPASGGPLRHARVAPETATTAIGSMVASSRSAVASRTPRLDVAVLEAERRRDFARGRLDDPRLHDFLIVRGVGNDSSARVDRMVREFARNIPEYARIEVDPALATTLGASGRGVSFFVLALTDRESASLRALLADAFPGGVERAAPDPAVVTQLAELGEVAVGRSPAVADLEVSPDFTSRFAFKDTSDADSEAQPDAAAAESDGPSPEQFNSAPDFSRRVRSIAEAVDGGRRDASDVAKEAVAPAHSTPSPTEPRVNIVVVRVTSDGVARSSTGRGGPTAEAASRR
ncbi:MAG: hypothetical protein KGM43_04830, partial [Planctomycetota bacterium]|nr:hypothetical protein [Planctomycetota bacterium]